MKKKSLGKVSLLTGALILAMTVSACGSSTKSSYSADRDLYAEESAAAEAPASDGGLYDAAYEEDYEETTTESSNGAEEITEEKAEKKGKRKLITNMSMTAETKEFDKTVDFLQHRTEELGGYVESYSTSKSNYSDERSAYMTLRVPEEKLSGFVNEVAEKSNIVSQEKNVTDITLTYADMESHKNALRAEEEQLLTLMEKAESIEDIMKIQDKLTEVRYQIESMESQLRTYDNQVSYSTLRVTVEEVIDYTPEPVKNPTFWERARDGFLENCSNVVTFFKELAIFLISHIITLLILAAIVIAIIFAVKRAGKKRKERLAKMPKHENSVMPPNGSFSYTQAPNQAGKAPVPPVQNQVNDQTNNIPVAPAQTTDQNAKNDNKK